MSHSPTPVIPPAPPVPDRDLSALALVARTVSDSLSIWPDYAFEIGFNRRTTFGLKSVFVNDPEGVRHVLMTNAANYRRPVIMPRLIRPLIGEGLFLSEGPEWRRQRRLLASSFTPNQIGLLLPHFAAAADDLVRDLDAKGVAALSEAFQSATLNAVLRALFSLPDPDERGSIATYVQRYVNGPGRPQVWDGFAKSETAFGFSLSARRRFQSGWFATVDALVAKRRLQPRTAGHRDFLDLLLDLRDAQTGGEMIASEVRDQCATMIFGAYETTARLLFWAAYLLTLDRAEQDRVRTEIAAFPPDRVADLDDLTNWPRLRMVLLEAMRLYPPLPLLVREPFETDEIMGQPVSRSTQVYISPWVLHRHRKHWINPTAFIPDRFEGQASPWTSMDAYIPFGAGPRICIGAAFAMAEAQIMLAAILHRFTLSIADARPVLPVGRLTTQPDHDPIFTLERVN